MGVKSDSEFVLRHNDFIFLDLIYVVVKWFVSMHHALEDKKMY